MTDPRDHRDGDPRGVTRRDAVRRGYDDLADAYEALRSPGSVEREAITSLLTRLENDPTDRPRLIDLGCGAGRGVLEHVAASRDGPDPSSTGVEAVGLDLSAEQLHRARSRHPGPLVRGDMTALPFSTGVADALTAFHSTIHVPRVDHEDLYREFARVLSPGGWLLVTVGGEAWEGTNDDWLDAGAAMHWSFPDLETTRKHLETAGFVEHEAWDTRDELADGSWPILRCRLRE